MKLPFSRIAKPIKRLLWLFAGMLLVLAPARADHDNPIRIAIPNSLFHMQYVLLSDLQQYLEGKLKRPVKLIMRRKVDDTAMQMYAGKYDFAWTTDYPHIHNFAHAKSGARLVAVPLYKGQPYYTSYLIVPAYDTRTKSLLQLKGAVFSLSDLNHNGCNLEVAYALQMAGEDPKHFFHKIIYAESQIEVIKAVTVGLAHAGAVESIVWDAFARARPDLAARTRVVAQTEAHGAPPLVANHFVSQENFKAMQRVLVDMAIDPKGLDLLKRLNLDGFTPGDENIYKRNLKMMAAIGEE